MRSSQKKIPRRACQRSRRRPTLASLPMKTSLLLALGAVTLVAAGCATQTTHNGTNTYILDGLVTVKNGYFRSPPPSAKPSDTTQWLATATRPAPASPILDDATNSTTTEPPPP